MLYELEAETIDVGPDDDRYRIVTFIVDAPAHRHGALPSDVVEWVDGWAYGAMIDQIVSGRRIAVKVATYQPARIGSRMMRANTSAVSSTIAEWRLQHAVRMSLTEWNHLPADHKTGSPADGTAKRLRWDDTAGTVLEPVIITA